MSAADPLSPRARALLDDMAANFDKGLVPLSIYNDPELAEIELDRIFNRSWVFVAHETELRNGGDYVLRTIGEDRWIITRDDEGVIHVLLDSCRHRGASVCPAERGNTTHFRCPYHGWTYRNTGKLAGVPHRAEAYRNLDLGEWGLLSAPHVATYRGLVFTCLDPDAGSLEDYLGDFRWYLDLHLGLTDLEVLGEPHRWMVDANWKLGAENFAGDSYHTQSVHKSVAEVGLVPGEILRHGAAAPDHQHVTECNGHAANLLRAVGSAEASQFWGYPIELTEQFRADDLSPEQLEIARWSLISTGTVFPNLSYLCASFTDAPEKGSATYFMLRQWQPRGAGRMELWSWVLAPAIATPEYKRRAAQVAASSFSPSGSFEEDDTVIWVTVSRAAKSRYARKVGAKLNYQMGMPEMGGGEMSTDWPGPGSVYENDLEDGPQRTVQRRWLSEMLRP